jgi:hypothetical protein
MMDAAASPTVTMTVAEVGEMIFRAGGSPRISAC